LLAPGCEHCYAASLVRRYAGAPGWPNAFDRPILAIQRLETALHWPDLTRKLRPDKPWLSGRPRHIFACDLADPFTESLPIDWLAPWLPRLADSPHIWILCTKRPHRARELFERYPAPPNLILLTTVTSAAMVWRIPALLQVRGIQTYGLSLEPLLGPVDLTDVRYRDEDCECAWDVLRGVHQILNSSSMDAFASAALGDSVPRLAWVIVGGESGPGARPMHPDWVRRIRDQGAAAGVPFFFKQWGGWLPCADPACRNPKCRRIHPDGRDVTPNMDWWTPEDAVMSPVPKKLAGRLLDGREWLQMPEVAA